MTRFTRTGKQVLLDGKHMADAVDDTAAMMILNALLAMDERATAGPTITDAVSYGFDRARGSDVSVRGKMIDGRYETICTTRREADEYACSCGLRWSVGEDDPHG